MSRVNTRAAGKGRDGGIARDTRDTPIVVVENHLNEVDIYEGGQFGFDLLHPYAFLFIEIVVVLLVARDMDVALIGGIENFGLIEQACDGQWVAVAQQSAGDGGRGGDFVDVALVNLKHLRHGGRVNIAPEEQIVITEHIGAAEMLSEDGEAVHA